MKRHSTFSMIASLFLMVSTSSSAADHLDSPSVENDGRLDLNDVYAFQSKENPANTVLVMTVNPLAGILSPTTFNSNGVYEFHIDNNGDAISDRSFSFYFSTLRGSNPQNVLVLRKNGSVLTSGKTGITKTFTGGGKLLVKTFEDPFFFDLDGFNNGFMFTGTDFFAGANVSAIVLEVPSSELGGTNVGVWARTLDGGNQYDRMGRPAINTVLISSSSKDNFNTASPQNDLATFGPQVNARIFALSGDQGLADALTPILLPDVLTVDVSSSAGFLNGRQPADDVIDAELNLLTNGVVTTDMVNQNDVPFLSVFPYLAPANN